ncbi:hypothetical protein [Kitasatospora mediocidica]|uniref:hypothetical protein n=1 Tax=Kitasatospora mediocidica TaxID=58352 RepID=UPI0012F800DD|nr:hypothetical protein [Kitasatospora mediocidica]
MEIGGAESVVRETSQEAGEGLWREIDVLISEGRTILAIKAIRETFGDGLREAVERFQTRSDMLAGRG